MSNIVRLQSLCVHSLMRSFRFRIRSGQCVRVESIGVDTQLVSRLWSRFQFQNYGRLALVLLLLCLCYYIGNVSFYAMKSSLSCRNLFMMFVPYQIWKCSALLLVLILNIEDEKKRRKKSSSIDYRCLSFVLLFFFSLGFSFSFSSNSSVSFVCLSAAAENF